MRMRLHWLMTDGALVRAIRGGHLDAFEPLVVRYEGKAEAIAMAIGVRSDARADVVQEAFLQAVRDLPQLRSPDAFGKSRTASLSVSRISSISTSFR